MSAVTYKNFRVERYELIGNEHVRIYIEAHQASGYAFFVWTFEQYRQKLAKIHPELARYIDDIRKGMSGYGPKEWEILDVLEEEGFEFEKYFIEYLDSNTAMVLDEIKRQTTHRSDTVEQQQLEEKMQEFDKYVQGNFINGSKFLDGLEKAIVTWLVDNYPEVMEGDPEDIDQIKTIMINYMMPLGEKLMNHVSAVRKKR
jgi:hypothetical protein